MQLIVLGFLSACGLTSLGLAYASAIARTVPCHVLARAEHAGRFAGLAPREPAEPRTPRAGRAVPPLTLGAGWA